MKKKFKVSVVRISYANQDIEVIAEDSAEAEILAMEEAGNLSYSEHDAEYDINYIEEIKENV
jgi:hypothetical protein